MVIVCRAPHLRSLSPSNTSGDWTESPLAGDHRLARIAGYSSQASLLTNAAGQYKSRICGTLCSLTVCGQHTPYQTTS